MTDEPTTTAALRKWIKDRAYAPDDFVLGPMTQLDGEGLASLHALLDIVWPEWRQECFPDA